MFGKIENHGERYEEERQASLWGDAIRGTGLIKPRRIWDLYAHRVIPFEFSKVDIYNHISLTGLYICLGRLRCRRYHPISHSWTEDMTPVDSPVNAHESPITLPCGVTLEAVRNELLNLGAQYVWLNVACLRQKCSDSNREALRMKEWIIDVPTIGKIYQPNPFIGKVIRYLNGLRKAFRRDGWQDKRHWSQRAWTLQEVCKEYIEAGLPKGVKDPLEESDDSGIKLRDHLGIGEVRQGSGRVGLYKAITAMKQRHSQNPVDMVLGLSTLLGCSALLTYSENEQPEDAWTRLLRHIDQEIFLQLLAYPTPGENGCQWRPPWRQLMEDRDVIKDLGSLKITMKQRSQMPERPEKR